MIKFETDKIYIFIQKYKPVFENIKLIISNGDKKAKRCRIKGSEKIQDWDLYWHGTLFKNAPSIVRYGFKKPGYNLYLEKI